MEWTNNRALKFVDLVTRHGAGHLPSVIKLRKAIAANSPIIDERVRNTMDNALDDLKTALSTEDFETFRRELSELLPIATRKRTDLTDAIQEQCIARMHELGMVPNQVAKLVEQHITRAHVTDYLSRRASMGSHRLQHVLTALNLRLAEK